MYIIYGTSNCGYCKRATALLQQQSIAFRYCPLDNDTALRDKLVEKYNWRTVPMIEHIEKTLKNVEVRFVGGHSDLVEELNGEKWKGLYSTLWKPIA